MKITSAKAIPVNLRLKEPFTISTETIDSAENIFIRLETDTGLIGWGCSTPDTVTSETKETVMDNFEFAKSLIVGHDPTRVNMLNWVLESSIVGNSSLKAGLNIAFYDLIGKEFDVPVYRLLGGFREKIETSVTVGIADVDLMVKRARQIVADGFRSVKIKCGMNVTEDIEKILEIRKAVGSSVKLRLDGNEGYSVGDALMLLSSLEESGVCIEMLEQPTKANYLYSLKDVKTHSSIPIVADETALTLQDNLKLVKHEIADVINIKLMKLGGITNSIKANVIAEAAGVPIMVGCMNESMGAMASGVHFACAFKNVEYADLDSVLDFEDDVVKGGAKYERGFAVPSENPGMGIEVRL